MPAPDKDIVTLLGTATDDELPELLDQLSGRFALLRLQSESAKVFNDAYSAQTVFYLQEAPFAISSHSVLLANAYRRPARKDISALISTAAYRHMRMKALPGDATLYDGIYGMIANHYYDKRTRRLVRYWPRRACHKTTFDEFFAVIDTYFRALARFVESPWKPIVSITGGIDSRTIIAAFHHYDVDFRTVTWTDFCFKEWEREPVTQIMNHIDRPHDWVNVNSDRINAISHIAAINTGNYRHKSRMVASMHRLYGNDPRAIFIRGHGANIIRGVSSVIKEKSHPISRITVDYLYERYKKKLKVPANQPDPIFSKVAVAAYSEFYRHASYENIEHFDYDLRYLSVWEFGNSMWASHSLNEVDAALYSIFGFNSRPAFEAAHGLPDNKRHIKELFLEVIRRYDRKLAEIYYE